jgi:hypothetical protein
VESATPRRVLIVAYRTAATPARERLPERAYAGVDTLRAAFGPRGRTRLARASPLVSARPARSTTNGSIALR